MPSLKTVGDKLSIERLAQLSCVCDGCSHVSSAQDQKLALFVCIGGFNGSNLLDLVVSFKSAGYSKIQEPSGALNILWVLDSLD